MAKGNRSGRTGNTSTAEQREQVQDAITMLRLAIATVESGDETMQHQAVRGLVRAADRIEGLLAGAV